MAGARGFMDGGEISFPCPRCGRNLKQTVGQGRRNRPIRCPGGHTVEVDGSSLNRATKQAEKAVDDIMRKLR